MALQLTGAAKVSSIANLQLRLPVVVIGGGLTAIDTATESLAYYVRQVEKFAARYRHAGGGARRDGGARGMERRGSRDRRRIPGARRGDRARSVRRRRGKGGRRALAQLLDGWGGATIAYRRRLIDSPSYTLNHEEVAKAMEEGVRFAEGLTPRAVEVDAYGHAAALRLKRARRVRGGAAGARRAGRRRHPAQHRAGARGRPDRAGRQVFPGDRRDRRAGVSPVRGLAKPDAAAGADAPRRRERPLRQLLRRPAPELLRQRREGDGRGEARLSRSSRACWRHGLRPTVSGADADRPLPRRTCRPVSRGAPADADHRRGGGARPGAARAFRPGQFYRLQNYEMLGPAPARSDRRARCWRWKAWR